jgi:hypothetical protein
MKLTIPIYNNQNTEIALWVPTYWTNDGSAGRLLPTERIVWVRGGHWSVLACLYGEFHDHEDNVRR